MPDSSNGFRLRRVDRLVVHEPVHRLLWRHAGEAGDLFGRRAKAGALEKVGGAIVGPVFGSDWRKVVHPWGSLVSRSQNMR